MKNFQTVVIWIKNLSQFLLFFFIETMLVKVKMVYWYQVLISLNPIELLSYRYLFFYIDAV